MNQLVLKHVFTALLLSCLVSACGWHLRGQVDLPVALRILNLDARLVDNTTRNLLRQSLLSNGVTISEDASYTLRLTGEDASRRTLAVTGNAKASEYELVQSLSFEVLDFESNQVAEESTVTSYRTLQYDAAAEIGKAQEEANLRREMKQANAYNVLLRLKAIKLNPIQAN